MRNLRLQLFVFCRQIGILFRQRIDAPRQIRVLFLNIRQLPLQLLIFLPSLCVLATHEPQSKASRQHQTRNAIFPHSFSLSLGDQLRERPSVVAPSAPRNKPYRTFAARSKVRPCPQNHRVLSRHLGAAPYVVLKGSRVFRSSRQSFAQPNCSLFRTPNVTGQFALAPLRAGQK